MRTRQIVRESYDFREGIRSYDSAPEGSLLAKEPYVDHGAGVVDKRRYTDPAEAQREWDKVWTKIWTLAGFVSDIPERGDWFKYDLGKESFVIVRGDDDQIRAFYNVCPHRGNQIVRSDFGRVTDCFSCSFHGWTFGKDGSLQSIREPETFRPEVRAKATGLAEVKCDTWGGMVFINMDENAEPLLDFLGVLPEHLAMYKLENYHVTEDFEYIFDANWKTTMDAFLEFYHAESVHPELGWAMETYYCQYDLYPKGISRMILPMGNAPDKLEDRDTVNETQKALLRQWGEDPDSEEWRHLKGYEFRKAMITAKRRLAKRAGWPHVDDFSDDLVVDDLAYSVFPNVSLNVYFDVNFIQIFKPHPTDPMKCVYRAINMVPRSDNPDFKPVRVSNLGQGEHTNDSGGGRPPIERYTDASEAPFAIAQDFVLIPPVQRGIESRAFKGFLFGEQEIRIRHYLAELDRYLAK